MKPRMFIVGAHVKCFCGKTKYHRRLVLRELTLPNVSLQDSRPGGSLILISFLTSLESHMAQLTNRIELYLTE